MTADESGAGPSLDRRAADQTEAAARTVIDAGLRRHDSAFTPGTAIWTPANADELKATFVDRPDASGKPFDQKLTLQLADASDQAVQLFTELFYLNLLPLMDYHGSTKRKLLSEMLGHGGKQVSVPPGLSSALDGGVFNGGVAFKTRRPFQLALLIEFTRAFLARPAQEQAAALDDPLRFRELLKSVKEPNEPAQRQGLLYLAHPKFFLPIVKKEHRNAIRDAFLHYIEQPTGDIDVDLHAINTAVVEHEGHSVDYYLAPWREQWDPKHQHPEDDGSAETKRSWLVRGSSVNGLDLVPVWRERGSMSLAATKLREVPAGIARDDLKAIVDEDYAHTSYAAKAEKLDEFHTFLSRMQPGHLVATTSKGRMYVGTITGSATYHQSSDGRSNLRRDVTWAGPPDGVDYSDLQADLAARLQVQRDVVDLTQQIDQIEAYLGVTKTEQPTARVVEDLVLPDATVELAQKLHVPREWLQECIELLKDRPQLIFYGPPGTGKTYIAQHLAEHIASDNVRLVQFHPSTSYEDFFEGYRPVDGGDGRVSFALKPGPMRKIVDQAVANPATPYVLIIDEINRGNLAKIFGELYFLLEYRDRTIDLLYASDDDKGFSLPRNVFLIGTMNTADRSIALVDAAMRRRFAFVPLHPSEPPTNGVLRSWLKDNDLDPTVADLLDRLNGRIDDADFKIGPSYFMRPAVHQKGGLERAWRAAILPLLEEHHYGESLDVPNRYGYEVIRQLTVPVTYDPGHKTATPSDSTDRPDDVTADPD